LQFDAIVSGFLFESGFELLTAHVVFGDVEANLLQLDLLKAVGSLRTRLGYLHAA